MGLFCSNFLRNRGPFPPCLSVWCGKCYQAHPEDPFPVQVRLDDEEKEDLETEERLDQRYRTGRDGDHLMGIPFECDLCHFRNVMERDPVQGNSKDDFTLLAIRRGSLDAMWSRETSTVSGNFRRLQRDYNDSMEVFSIKKPMPVIGTNEVKDRVGMRITLMTLNSSLRIGRYLDTIQWDTMRKTPTWWTNAFEAGEEYGEGAIYSSNDKKVYESTAPTASRWFARFMLGAKRRMGVVRKQDEALTVEQLLAVCEIAEDDWRKSKSEAEKKDIESVISFMIIGFCISLRGEEVPLIVIEGMLAFWDETRVHKIPHMMITLKGKFKGENNLRWHCVPLADQTQSRIPTRRWISRMLHRRAIGDQDKVGYLFARPKGRKSSLGDYDPLFRDYLERAQEKKPKLFTAGVPIKDFSLRRSLRRGATTEAENNNVDAVAIELTNRWRKKEAARGAEAGLSMRQVYTQVSRAVVATLRFSQSH